jgi:diguanylate cyclase (GGDEF)-like protein
MDLPLDSQLAIAGIAIVLVGALAGTAGYAATFGRRQLRRITDLTERLAAAEDPRDLVATERVRDPRLRAGFERLARRIAESLTLATMDLLTGIPNRQALLTRLNDEIERATRYERQLSVVLIDIDHFKRLNDAHGHAAGDLVLHHVAQALQANLRSVDIMGRYGGEEFMAVLPETDVDSAASIAEKLRRLVGRYEVALEDGNRVHVTLSAGVAGGLGRNVRLDSIIRDADAALYSAKALGRNQVFVFHEIEDSRLVPRAAIAPSAREAAVEVGRLAMGEATRSLTDALSSRAGWAGKPSTLIAETATAMAATLGLPDGEIERIRTASLLHDLGKLAIPDEILSKPSELDEPEWRVVAEHPKIGQIVLEQAGALRDAATIVLHHHEWYDGRGYPHGLRGQEIPVGARIVAVADAYEAMIAGRPYRGAVTHEAALAELERHAGIQFDPEMVALFTSLFSDGVPWSAHGHDHPHPHPVDKRSHAEIHDTLHARRRRVQKRTEDTAATGTDG